ncbi:MAG: RdgB/HAM1 family non-canonical purine NTP pyrophosphatase [Geminicoccaceae bacterium]
MTSGAARRFSGDRLVLASHNPGKLREFRALLAPLGVDVISAGALALPEPEETGDSFEANARLKAQAAANASGLPALADDSGLCVDGLDGAPGVYSARWAGADKDFQAAMRLVHDRLAERHGPFADAPKAASFVAVLCLAWPDGEDVCVTGRCTGELIWPPRGDGGFGYDPMFVPEGETRSFGEMSAADKQRFSHRARAAAALRDACFAA